MNHIRNPHVNLQLLRRAAVLGLLAAVVTFTACSDSTPASLESTSGSDSVELTDANQDRVFDKVDEMPELIGGLQAVSQSITYPDEAKKNKIEGRVIVQFIVEKDGSVSNAEVTNYDISGGPDEAGDVSPPGFDEEALRVVRGIAFEPGRHEGENVRVRLSLPITFRLD